MNLDTAATTIRDKRVSAHHEAAHAVAAAARGNYGRAWLIPTGACEIETKAWAGLFQSLCPIDAVVAVAGMVGEAVYDEPDLTPDTLFDYWESWVIEPSETDLHNIPDDWSARLDALREAFDTLTRQRPLFERVAQELFEEEYVGNGRMRELAEQHLVPAPPPARKGGKGKK